jgi:hypothetical protein
VTRLLVAVGVAAVAVAVALVLRRRQRHDAPTQGGWTAPTQLDRADFAGAERPWLVATFSSASCQTCADVVRKAAVLASGDVAVTDVEYGTQTELHRRYRVDAVPLTVIADRDGVVHASFIGPVTATDLWAAVAEVRSPGSSPEPDLGR